MGEASAQSYVLVWAITMKGEWVSTCCADRAEAEEIGRFNVSIGAWRTWDAFEVSGQTDTTDASRKYVSSQYASKRRPRILADWTPPVLPAAADQTAAGAGFETDTKAMDSTKLPRPRILANWTPGAAPPPDSSAPLAEPPKVSLRPPNDGTISKGNRQRIIPE